MRNPKEEGRIILPKPADHAYFPETGTDEILANEALRRTGGKLSYAIEYGSHVFGDAGPTSRRDMMLIVPDARDFHTRNMSLAGGDYGVPRSVAFHTFLNRFGFNFYQTQIPAENMNIPVKYAVIDEDRFVRGCNGSLAEKERDGTGAFGFYVAGRVQKAALRPLHKGTEEQTAAIEQAINTARIDGVWLALGLQDRLFTVDALTRALVSLSYRADLRIEKPGKIESIAANGREEYHQMLKPILNGFEGVGLIRQLGETEYEALKAPPKAEVEARLRSLRIPTALTNYIKNPLTVGVGKGVRYALEKVQRAHEATKTENKNQGNSGTIFSHKK